MARRYEVSQTSVTAVPTVSCRKFALATTCRLLPKFPSINTLRDTVSPRKSLGVADQMLPSPQADFWDAYLAAENRGVRHERNAALERFLDSFSNLPSDLRRKWALDFAARSVDDGDDPRVRMPLFRGVLLPALQSAIADREPGAARWLSGFAQHIYRCSELRHQIERGTLADEHGLLLIALDHDPDDDRSRRRLVKLMADQLAFSLHELPSGVLYGMDGATIPQCQELLAYLKDFLVHTNRLGITQNYDRLIADCRFHYDAYIEYISNRDGNCSYAEFLSQIGDA